MRLVDKNEGFLAWKGGFNSVAQVWFDCREYRINGGI